MAAGGASFYLPPEIREAGNVVAEHFGCTRKEVFLRYPTPKVMEMAERIRAGEDVGDSVGGGGE